MALPVPAPTPEPARQTSTLVPKVKPAVLTVGIFAAVLVVVQIVNSLMSYRLNPDLGLAPRTLHGLIGILAAPLLHTTWYHLLSNIVPFVIFGFLIMVGGARQFVAVTVLVWLVSGIGLWIAGPSGVTVGASGLVFGWLAYLVTRGVFTRNWGQIAIGLVLLAIWGGLFWTGIVKVALGGSTGISWQGHLFGALGGVLAAFLVAKADGPHRKAPTPAA